MLGNFRRNHFFNSLLLFPYVLILYGTYLYQSATWSESVGGVASAWVYSYISSGFLQNILAIVLLFFQAVLLNRLVIINRLSNGISLFAGVFYILICSFAASNSILSPVILANTFFILAITDLFYAFKKSSNAGKIFNAGLWTGLATLFYAPYIVFIIFGLVGLSILRVFKIRDTLQFLVGFLNILFLYLVIHYFSYGNVDFLENLFPDFGKLNWKLPERILNFAILLIFALLVVFSIFTYNGNTIKKSIQARKKIDVLYWIFLFAGISILLFQTVGIHHLLILAVPLGIFLGFRFFNMKSKPLAEFLHLCLFLLSIGLQVLSMFTNL